MSRHQKAINRYIAIVFSIPLTLVAIMFLWVNPFTQPYLFWTTPIVLYNFLTFLLIGLVAILFEMPFTQPDLIASKPAGRFGTGLVAGIGIIAFVFAGLIISGIYNVSTDGTIVKTLLAFVYLPIAVGMFSLELFDVVVRQRRFAVHKYAGA